MEVGVAGTRMKTAEVTVEVGVEVTAEVGVAGTRMRADGTATTAGGSPRGDGTTATSSSSSRSEPASEPAAWRFYK